MRSATRARPVSAPSGWSRSRSCEGENPDAMNLAMLAPMVVGLLPVVTFLAVLLYLDSYKLVKLRTVVAVVACGAAVAVASYQINAVALFVFPLDLSAYSRYAAPVVEE